MGIDCHRTVLTINTLEKHLDSNKCKRLSVMNSLLLLSFKT